VGTAISQIEIVPINLKILTGDTFDHLTNTQTTKTGSEPSPVAVTLYII